MLKNGLTYYILPDSSKKSGIALCAPSVQQAIPVRFKVDGTKLLIFFKKIIYFLKYYVVC
jgi:hypothetical protein